MIFGLTIDPVAAAAVAAGSLRLIEWPSQWTAALQRQGVGRPSSESRPIAGLSVLVHGALAWSPEHQRRALQLDVDDRARGHVVARAVIDGLVDGRAQLREVEPISPVVTAGNALEPWLPSQTLRRRLGLGIAEAPTEPTLGQQFASNPTINSPATPPSSGQQPHHQAASNPTIKRPATPPSSGQQMASKSPSSGAKRIWCGSCWRLVGVALGDRSVVVRGTQLQVARRSPRCGVAAFACAECAALARETTPSWATELDDPAGATEDLTRALLDRALGGVVPELLANRPMSAADQVPVVDAEGVAMLVRDRRPPDSWLGRVVALRWGGAVSGVARLAAYVADEAPATSRRAARVLHGQRPAWCVGASDSWPAGCLWLLDSVVSIAPFWAGEDTLSGDLLLLLVERLRATNARLVPWVRWPDAGLPLVALFGQLPREPASACTVAAMGMTYPDATWDRWRLVGGELVGYGGRVEAPAPRAAWAALVRGARQGTPAPYPTGPAPAGRYLTLGPDGPRFIDHAGGDAEGVIWIARVPAPAITAGEDLLGATHEDGADDAQRSGQAAGGQGSRPGQGARGAPHR